VSLYSGPPQILAKNTLVRGAAPLKKRVKHKNNTKATLFKGALHFTYIYIFRLFFRLLIKNKRLQLVRILKKELKF
jgi:hypothetical protein